jgi:hypothetical protein
MIKTYFAIFILLSSVSQAQTISGRVIDEQSHSLSFVTVSDARTHTGSYTDDEGRFRIDIPSGTEDDVIIFSHIGYEEVRMSAAQISSLSSTIQLKPKNYSLKDVVIRPTAAKDMLIDALSHIKDNYPLEFTKNHIIFKDYSKISGEKNHYNFFDFDMYLPSYMAKDSPRIYSKDNRHEMYEKKGALLSAQITPVELLKMMMYPEKVFDEKALREHEYTLLTSSTMIDSEEYNVISFRRLPKKSDRSVTSEGTIYINKRDKGIRYINFHVYNQKSQRFALVIKMDTMNVNVRVAYKKIDDKYALDYISQTTYASGSLVGKKMNVEMSSSEKVIDRTMHLKMNEIVMKTEVDDIILREKPKDIKEMETEPDMK